MPETAKRRHGWKDAPGKSRQTAAGRRTVCKRCTARQISGAVQHRRDKIRALKV